MIVHTVDAKYIMPGDGFWISFSGKPQKRFGIVVGAEHVLNNEGDNCVRIHWFEKTNETWLVHENYRFYDIVRDE